MDTRTAYLRAAIPDRVAVLKLPLRPYCLGHELILRRLGNGFLNRPLPPAGELIPHLFSGVLICSLSYADALEAIDAPDWNTQFKAWRRRLGRHYDFHHALVSFAQYVRDGSAWPEFSRVRRRGWERIVPGAPLESVLLASALGELGLTHDQALNLPLGHLLWLYCTHRELQGSIKVLHDGRPPHLTAALEATGWKPWRVEDCDFPEPGQCTFPVPPAPTPAAQN